MYTCGMYVHMYMYMCTHVDIYIYIYTHIPVYMHVHTYMNEMCIIWHSSHVLYVYILYTYLYTRKGTYMHIQAVRCMCVSMCQIRSWGFVAIFRHRAWSFADVFGNPEPLSSGFSMLGFRRPPSAGSRSYAPTKPQILCVARYDGSKSSPSDA